jgi:hypothetical protein
LNKLLMLGAILALVLVATVPALAQVSNEIEQDDIASGDVALGFSVSNKGNYASQCTPASQFGNTGNFDNGHSFIQVGEKAKADDFEPGGIEVGFGGSNSTSCPSTIQQSSAASSTK